ncbi:phosphatidylserine decarboxylase proenzyme 2-like isoform X3 [Magnolia sinica]|uniref:phosphatidylserine decarboxylase proenzyme 2-like isoform X3 n=1 Tax=Magnolia sinica TaxID=86752 RepID=UPI002659EA59|nr:phosphatidylserine decarboxylase proenzyme 2-like isoform X3 [Magnolia sinica]
MGHGSSKSNGAEPSDAGNGSETSRISRIRRRLHLHRRGSASDSSNQLKNIAPEEFTGIAHIQLIEAEMKFKDRWFACVSLGERTFRTPKSDQTDKPVWKSEKKLVLERNGPHIARISVFETNRLSRNNLIGYCEIDLLEVLSRESDYQFEVLDLVDPSSSDKVVGTISLSCSVEDPIETEKSFARRILAIVDYNEDGMLSLSEFTDLINAFGNQAAANKKEELFKEADKNGDGVVSMDELASLLAAQQEEESLISSCPVCGESLGSYDRLNDIIHLTLCFDEGTGNQVMTGGFITDKQASYGWIFKLSEWAHVSSYDIGLKSGSSASHIVVFDRKTKRLVEELIDGKIILSMRAIYQSKVGLTLINAGAKELLQSISEKQGRRMNSPESAKDIPKFIEFFKDQINVADAKYPIEHFETFNEFFIRELKPDARPIAHKEHDDIAICASDCRLMAFQSIDDSLRFWIKVNPIAVNSKYCNVFTENKRVVSLLSTEDFGKVAFIAIGATMVGSITFTRKQGERVQKGDEFGYFSFGGSTVICVFEKDTIEIDEDLLANSKRSLETLVTVGMSLGVSKQKRAETGSLNLEGFTIS